MIVKNEKAEKRKAGKGKSGEALEKPPDAIEKNALRIREKTAVKIEDNGPGMDDVVPGGNR